VLLAQLDEDVLDHIAFIKSVRKKAWWRAQATSQLLRPALWLIETSPPPQLDHLVKVHRLPADQRRLSMPCDPALPQVVPDRGRMDANQLSHLLQRTKIRHGRQRIATRLLYSYSIRTCFVLISSLCPRWLY